MITTKPQAAIPARPMNAEPISYPLVRLSAVSKDAQILHNRACDKQKLDRDVFDKKSRSRYVTREEAEEFEPTDRILAAIAELTDARLADYRPEYQSVYATAIHPEYTIAHGRGSQLIHVSIFDEQPDRAKLVAVLVGGDLDTRSSHAGMSEVRVLARHENATDFEHDASTTASLTIRNASPAEFSGYGGVKFTGVLTQARLYPIGVDPLTAEDSDTPAAKVCTRCEESHPFAPYQPPEIESLKGPRFVKIETLPFRPYLIAAVGEESA